MAIEQKNRVILLFAADNREREREIEREKQDGKLTVKSCWNEGASAFVTPHMMFSVNEAEFEWMKILKCFCREGNEWKGKELRGFFTTKEDSLRGKRIVKDSTAAKKIVQIFKLENSKLF